MSNFELLNTSTISSLEFDLMSLWTNNLNSSSPIKSSMYIKPKPV